MAYRRFYIEREAIAPDAASVILRGDLLHHLKDVCRFQVGDAFEVLPGDGRAWLVEITDLSGREAVARKVSERQLPAPQKPHVTLCLSVPKLPKVDWIVEKSVELGAHALRLFVSDYSFLRKTSEISPSRLARWQKLVQAATQQSGRGTLLTIHAPVTLKDLLSEFNRNPSTAGLFPYEGETNLGLSQALVQLKAQPKDDLWVFVGSEGGFSRSEVEMMRAQGLEPVSMGEQILRVETACVALLSIIKYEVGALR